MQLMCDALSVLGSRHGLVVNPIDGNCGIIRWDRWTDLPVLHLRAGIRIGRRERVFPLCPDGERFRFFDQRISPCSIVFIGVDAESGIKAKLSIFTPFRPRDAAFSTTPVLGFRLEAERLKGNFRWEKQTIDANEIELFIEPGGPSTAFRPAPDGTIEMQFASLRSSTEQGGSRSKPQIEALEQTDRWLSPSGSLHAHRFTRCVDFAQPSAGPLDVFWCTWSEPVLRVRNESCPFKYTETFPSLDAVCDWVRAHPAALVENARRVDGIVARNNCAASVNKLLAQSLHSWLINTWWTVRPDGRNWFSVWEGSCYFHSTVDVEYTQSPFYLAVWPELLGIELDFWPEFSKDGTHTLGERGAGTLFLSHDTGSHASACGQDYPHEMEVEETANYLILCAAYCRRTGDDGPIRKHADTIRRYLAFLRACDTTGSGVPDQGVANTIDDASPAIQFGKDQMYLAVKCLVAFEVGAGFLEHDGDEALAAEYRDCAQTIRARIDARGWDRDHFVTLLDKSGKGIRNPWSGEPLELDEVPGWDAPHIYTANGLVPMDMVGWSAGLDEDRIRRDLVVATQRCLREYGCVHTDFSYESDPGPESMQGLAGMARNPGWISMNMLRDLAAFYRGVDLRYVADRYWDWQTTTNSQEPKIFFETFHGNNLCFYPRGVAIWGIFDALGGLVIDQTSDIDRSEPRLPMVKVPRLWDADWVQGECAVIR